MGRRMAKSWYSSFKQRNAVYKCAVQADLCCLDFRYAAVEAFPAVAPFITAVQKDAVARSLYDIGSAVKRDGELPPCAEQIFLLQNRALGLCPRQRCCRRPRCQAPW